MTAIRRLLLALALPVSFATSAGATLEYQVKAAYLYNFARFIDWSASGAQTPEFQICVEGSAEVSDALGPVIGQSVAGRTVVVRRVTEPDPGCQIVYVAREASGQSQVVTPAGVLTVSDAPGFLARGGMVELVLRDGRLRFRINREATQAAGLRVPPQLLALAVD